METLSRLDLFELGRQYVLTRAKRIDPRVIDTQGSDANLFIGSASFMASAVSNQIAQASAELFLDSCFGEQLDRYVYDRYRLLRLGAAAALGSVTFSRPNAVAGAGSIPAGTKLITLTGIEYLTLQAASFSSSDLSVSVDVRAAQAGKAFQIGANGIRQFDDISLVFDATLLVNNPLPCAGGEDVELDDTFKQRVRNFWLAQRRGTLGAIEFGALLVPGVASALALDELSTDGNPVRVVRLIVADSSGVASRALGAKVQAVLNEWRAGGIFVYTDVSSPQIVDIQLHLVFAAGVDTVSLKQEVLVAVVNYVNSLGVGQALLLSDLQAVLARYKSAGLIVTTPGNDLTIPATVVVPTGDVVPLVGKTLRTTLANVLAV
jgi:uncharacterized phage protein gp47/JayE